MVSPQNKEDEGTPTSQNTLCSTTEFTRPSQNHPQATPPPENPSSTQYLEHHSLCDWAGQDMMFMNISCTTSINVKCMNFCYCHI
jgi:hypothetical protein